MPPAGEQGREFHLLGATDERQLIRDGASARVRAGSASEDALFQVAGGVRRVQAQLVGEATAVRGECGDAAVRHRAP